MKARMLIFTAAVFTHMAWAQGQQPNQAEAIQARRDQLHAAVQRICPVSGNQLGEHGPPVKVTVGESGEQVFLCCQACLQRTIDPSHWTTIHKNAAAAQRICPVMEHELPEKPKWTIVEGRVVYVCCPPCTKKIAANPADFLRKVDALYAATLQSTTVRR